MSIDLQEQYDKVYRYCYFRLHNQWKAEDITQETFLRYLECNNYKDVGRPLAYLYTIARNLCIDELRRRVTEPLSEEFPEEEFESRLVNLIVVREAVKGLKQQEQELILLRYANEVSVADLARIYGKSRYAMYRELKKIIQKLERRIKDEEG